MWVDKAGRKMKTILNSIFAAGLQTIQVKDQTKVWYISNGKGIPIPARSF